ncbi:MAG: hypothetical protein C4523_20740 [Myxococcales bacterium]|nr:MAG: hypothetical protein C4523_20740 [Myxococcales bacterium]
MELGKTLYVAHRDEWRAWLARHYNKEKEIWLIFYKQRSGKPRLPYNDAVEEALCFGWIDSTVKRMDEERFAQRFSPRRPNSELSEMNRERVRRLMAEGKMTAAGLEAIKHRMSPKGSKSGGTTRLVIAPDILAALKEDPLTWKNFQKFPASYKRIRIGWIEGARSRQEFFQKRLAYFLKMTRLNKRYGMVQ